MKKGDLSLNIIIITVILLVVLVVVLMVFTGRMDIFSKGLATQGSPTKTCTSQGGDVKPGVITCPKGTPLLHNGTGICCPT